MINKLLLLWNRFIELMTFRQRFFVFFWIYLLCLALPFYWLIQGVDLYISSAESLIQNDRHQLILNSLLNETFSYYLSSPDDREKAQTQVMVHLNELKEIHPSEAEILISQWEALTKKPNKTFLTEDQHFIEQILHQLLREKSPAIHLLLDNQAFLHDLYIAQVSTFEVFYWHQFQALLQLKESLSGLENKIEDKISFKSLIENPRLKKYLVDKGSIQRYFKHLKTWIAQIEAGTFYPKEHQIQQLLNENNYITNGLLNYGIDHNQRIKNIYSWVRNGAILAFFIVVSLVIFYYIFRVLTVHFEALSNHIEAVSLGRFKKCFCSYESDEFGAVGKNIDQMASSIQQVVKELQLLGRGLSESIKQLTSTSKDQNQIILNNEKKIQEVEEYTESIVNRSQMLALTMKELSLNASESRLVFDAENMLKKMHGIIDSLASHSTIILQHLTSLQNKIERYKKLFSFLYKVSNQASLLSLNSSIAASNIKGSNRPSFVKVTEEIKRFALKTQSSSNDIENIIKDISMNIDHVYKNTNYFVSELEQGREQFYEFEKYLFSLIKLIGTQVEKFHDINQIMQEQTTRAAEIKTSLDKMVDIANKNHLLTHHLDDSMKNLGTVSEKLQEILNLFFHPKRQRSNVPGLFKDE